VPPKLPKPIQELVRERAKHLCEYCHTDEHWQAVRFTIDHVVPLDLGGETAVENLALACFHCNRRKSNKQVVLDPATGQTVPLFNPRLHHWNHHFWWSADGLLIVHQTSIGAATISLLELNRDRIIHIRAADVSAGRHPPTGDMILID